MLMLQPLAIAAIVILLRLRRRAEASLLTLGGHHLCFFVIAMACHGELARTRPAAKYLTGFYVALSVGGMVGGLFAGLVAPSRFYVDRRISDPGRGRRAVPAVGATSVSPRRHEWLLAGRWPCSRWR